MRGKVHEKDTDSVVFLVKECIRGNQQAYYRYYRTRVLIHEEMLSITKKPGRK